MTRYDLPNGMTTTPHFTEEGDSTGLIVKEPHAHFLDSDEMIGFLERLDSKELPVISSGNIEILPNMNVVLRNGKSQEFRITDTGFSDLCSLASMGSTATRRHIEGGFTDWTRGANQFMQSLDQDVKPIVRGGNLVALRSNTFSLVKNVDMARDIMKSKPDRYSFLGGYFTPWNLKLIFINEDGKINFNGKEYSSAFSQKNSETGHSALKYLWSLFTWACTNLNLFGGRNMFGVSGVHREGQNGGLRDRAPQFLSNFLQNSIGHENVVQCALPLLQNTRFEEDGKFTRHFQDQLDGVIGKKRAKTYMEEAESNILYDEWDRVTQTARDYKSLDTREGMENIGGWMMHYIVKNQGRIKNGILN